MWERSFFPFHLPKRPVQSGECGNVLEADGAEVGAPPSEGLRDTVIVLGVEEQRKLSRSPKVLTRRTYWALPVMGYRHGAQAEPTRMEP